MTGRFLDNKKVIEADSGFVERKHGISWERYMVAYGIAAALVLLIFSLLAPGNILLLIMMLVVLVALGSITYLFINNDRQIITAMELQNALFAGAAKLATEFCIILKYDGTVVYVDPEYNRKFFHLREQGLEGLDALCESGGLDKKSKDKLLLALSEGRNESVPFILSEPVQGMKSIALTLEPIGVYARKDQKKRLSLAVNPLTRPSGYFFLSAKRDVQTKEYHDYLNEFAIGFYSLKSNGKFLAVNDTFAKILGYDKKELLSGESSLSRLIIEEKDAQTISKSEQDWHGEVLFRHKAGEKVRIFVSQMVLRNENEEIIGRRGVILQLILDDGMSADVAPGSGAGPDILRHSPIATALLDSKGNIVRSNAAFNEIVGEKTSEVKEGKWSLLDIVSKETRDELKALLDKMVQDKNAESKPIDVKIKGAHDATASVYVNHIINEQGELIGLIAHLIDATELKNLELRFVHSQKMQAVGQLAGGIAHDFNNLLTAMMGFCDLLLMRHPAGDQSFADIMQIKQNANRAANLVRQLLAFSRKQTLQPKVINITDVFADLSNLLGRLIGENIELKMVHGKDLWRVKVDQGQLEQVIINLAVNARDAMKQGGVLTISTSNVTIDDKHPISRNMLPPAEDEIIENGDYILVEVKDTGCGMDKELMGKIFEPFFSTKELGSGTGLGLSTVYGIVKQTGGYIYVSSKPTKGTKFSIFLKRYESNNKDDEKKIEPTLAVATADLTGTGTILLVEDEAPVRLFSISALTNKGYKVLEAESGEQALDIMKEKGDEIDIIITDVVMPGINGPAMIEKISKKYPEMKVIFISGYAEDAFLKTYGEERRFHFLSKPYTLKQLAMKVKEVLEKE